MVVVAYRLGNIVGTLGFLLCLGNVEKAHSDNIKIKPADFQSLRVFSGDLMLFPVFQSRQKLI